ncbi:hypothetical protein LOC51_03115 [Rubrivivax sp. JA1024]|nr:hypothetical protein [Rubrivivax sp. JA1024]
MSKRADGEAAASLQPRFALRRRVDYECGALARKPAPSRPPSRTATAAAASFRRPRGPGCGRGAGSREKILEIDVRGKKGVGFCKSVPGALFPFERIRKRRSPAQTDLVFPASHSEWFNAILDEQKLKFDREGQRRTF